MSNENETTTVVPVTVLERIVTLQASYDAIVEYARRERLTHKGSIREQIRERGLDLRSLKSEWGVS